MKTALLALSLAVLASSSQAFSDSIGEPADHAVNHAAIRRAAPVAPNGYAPGKVTCPTTRPSVRSASSLSLQETAWVEKRRNITIEPLKDFLSRMNIANFDAASYIQNNKNNASALPNVAIAFSGGGYRAMLNGAGAFKAFDNRTDGSTGAGGLGGLVQASTYVAGLSGGSWLVGSIYVNNFTTIGNLQADPSSSSVWDLSNSIFQGPAKAGLTIKNTATYFGDLVASVGTKSTAGFETTITDFWARALSYQFVNATDGGPSLTWSSIANDSTFSAANSPMPLVVADGRAPGETLIPTNTTNFEFNPFEFGSFDPTTYGFIPLQYIGSKFDGGVIPASEACIAGFDNAAYVMGTSSSLFNTFLLQINSGAEAALNIPQAAINILGKALQKLSTDEEDIADYSPNPFYHYNNETNLSANSTQLTLVDGGEDLQNIPLAPVIQPKRAVDVVFAVDSSADTDYFWPNGTALVASYQRSLLPPGSIANGTSFPAIPDYNTMVNLGLNNRPTFFGCNSTNTSSITPIIVYIPNSPYVYNSNVSTFDPSYNDTERDAIILNGYNVATQANGSLDSSWGTCVGCAILSRSLERTRTPIPDACTSCFKKYCWDGSLNSTASGEKYQPPYKAPADKRVNVTAGAATSSKKKSAATRNVPFAASAVVYLGRAMWQAVDQEIGRMRYVATGFGH